MAKDRITALVLGDHDLEWSTVPLKGQGRVLASGCEAFVPPREHDKTDIAAEPDPSVGSQLAEACGKLKHDSIVAGMSTNQVLLRVVELPEVSDAELAGMVELQVDKYSPFPVDAMVMGHEVLDRHDGMLRVLVAAAREDLVNELGRTLRAAGLHTDRIDAAILGWWRVLHDSELIGAAGRDVFVFPQGPNPDMIVVQDGIPVLFRAFSGLETLDEDALAEELCGEVSHSLMALELEHGGGAATSVTLCLTEDAPGDLLQRLTAACGGEVKTLALEALPSVTEGLARRAVDRASGRMDLTPDAWRSSERAALLKGRLITAVGSLVLVWILTIGALLGVMAYQKRRVAVLGEDLVAWEVPGMQVREMRRRVYMIERYKDVKTSSLECLREVSSVLPSGMELTSFSYRKGEALKLSGEAGSVDLVYAFKNKLDAGDIFESSDLVGPHTDPRTRKEMFDVDLLLPGIEE